MTWLKEKWEWVVAALVAILAFALGRRGKQAAKEEVELKNKEIEIIQEASAEEDKRKQVALERYLRETARLREEYKKAETSLELLLESRQKPHNQSLKEKLQIES